MRDTKHWAADLKQKDKILATIRHITDGKKNKIDKLVEVVSVEEDHIQAKYRGKIINIPFNELQKLPKDRIIDYIYEFAAIYGQYYHNKDFDTIMGLVNQKIELPESFITRVLKK